VTVLNYIVCFNNVLQTRTFIDCFVIITVRRFTAICHATSIFSDFFIELINLDYIVRIVNIGVASYTIVTT